MGGQEINTRMYFQCPILHTALARWKNKESPITAPQHQKIHNKNTEKNPRKTGRRPPARILRHPMMGRALITYPSRSGCNQKVDLHHS